MSKIIFQKDLKAMVEGLQKISRAWVFMFGNADWISKRRIPNTRSFQTMRSLRTNWMAVKV